MRKDGVWKMKNRILIVDDESMLTELLESHLTNEGYLTCAANNAEEAMKKLSFLPDLILLDINMPDMDGLKLCEKIRSLVSCPILFLTARVTEQDKITGLLMGGDDYITKPFSLGELTARIGAHLRREDRVRRSDRLLLSGQLMVNLDERKVSYLDQDIPLSKKEFDILELLIRNPGHIFDREQLYDTIWGWDAQGDSAVVKEHIRKLRGKLQSVTGRDEIETVWGIGYKWKK